MKQTMLMLLLLLFRKAALRWILVQAPSKVRLCSDRCRERASFFKAERAKNMQGGICQCFEIITF